MFRLDYCFSCKLSQIDCRITLRSKASWRYEVRSARIYYFASTQAKASHLVLWCAVHVRMLLLHSCQSQCAWASWLLGARTLLWPCGLLLEMQRRSHPMHSPLPPSSPSPPPSTTQWSTCCASPTSASVFTETRPCWGSGCIGEVRIWNRRNAWESPRSAARTWVFPHAFQMDSRTAMGLVCSALRTLSRVTWPALKGLPVSWLVPATERWQSASSQHKLRLTWSSGASTLVDACWAHYSNTQCNADTSHAPLIWMCDRTALWPRKDNILTPIQTSPLMWTFATDLLFSLYLLLNQQINDNGKTTRSMSLDDVSIFSVFDNNVFDLKIRSNLFLLIGVCCWCFYSSSLLRCCVSDLFKPNSFHTTGGTLK